MRDSFEESGKYKRAVAEERRAKKQARQSWDGFLKTATWDVQAARELYMSGMSVNKIIALKRFVHTSGPYEGRLVGQAIANTARRFGWAAARAEANQSATMAAAKEAGRAHQHYAARETEERLRALMKNEPLPAEEIETLAFLKSALQHAKDIMPQQTKPQDIEKCVNLVASLKMQIAEMEGRGTVPNDDQADPEDAAQSELAKQRIAEARQKLEQESLPVLPPRVDPQAEVQRYIYGAPPEVIAKVKESDVETMEHEIRQEGREVDAPAGERSPADHDHHAVAFPYVENDPAESE